MQHKVTLPCSPLVKDYLHRNYGSPIKLTRKSPIGKFFYTLLANPCQRFEKRAGTYDNEVVVLISDDEFTRRSGWKLTKNDIVEINNMITDQVYGLMYVAIEAREDVLGTEFQIKKAIKWFFQYMQFSTDAIHLDTAAKAYYRFREKRDNKLIHS